MRHGVRLYLAGPDGIYTCTYLIFESCDLLRHFDASDKFGAAAVNVEAERVVDVVRDDIALFAADYSLTVLPSLYWKVNVSCTSTPSSFLRQVELIFSISLPMFMSAKLMQ